MPYAISTVEPDLALISSINDTDGLAENIRYDTMIEKIEEYISNNI